MKKLVLSLSLLAGVIGAAQAQSTIGITVGVGRTGLLGNNVYSSVNHFAYQAGLTADAYFGETISFHPELLYTKQYFDASDSHLSRDVDYISVPLLARYHADGPFFEAGPEVNFTLAAKNEDGNDVKSQAQSVVLSYVVGLGYQLNHGPSLGIRYDGGATNVFKSDVATLGTGKLKSSTFWLNLSYAFGGSGSSTGR